MATSSRANSSLTASRWRTSPTATTSSPPSWPAASSHSSCRLRPDQGESTMPYTPHKPPIAESSDELRARIPGWGADLDPKDRPSVPKLRFQENVTGAHWEFPERQPEKWPRERSIEHEFLTPVFGTAQPPSGISGAIRKYSYAKYSEGRAAH